jgi:hypothetical protein
MKKERIFGDSLWGDRIVGIICLVCFPWVWYHDKTGVRSTWKAWRQTFWDEE